MSRSLFLRIVNEVEQYDPYIIQRTDAVGVLGLTSLQKITATYRILAKEHRQILWMNTSELEKARP